MIPVTEKDLLKLCDEGPRFLIEDPCGPAAAFFWAAAAVQAPDPSCRRLVGLGGEGGGCCACSWSTSVRPRLPAISAFEIVRPGDGGGTRLMAITTRGTMSLEDARADLTVLRTRSSFERRARKAVSAAVSWAKEMVEADLAETSRAHFGFHHGFYLLAAKVLGPVIEAIETRKPDIVVFYGHSLGAAVASFLYRWIRSSQKHKRDVRLAVMASPAICDAKCFVRWFDEPLGDDGNRARHYCTAGDLVVRRLPGMAAYDRHATVRGEYVADAWDGSDAANEKIISSSSRRPGVRSRVKNVLKRSVATALLSHLSLVPGTLRSRTDPSSARPRVPLGVPDGAVFTFSAAKVSAFARRIAEPSLRMHPPFLFRMAASPPPEKKRGPPAAPTRRGNRVVAEET
jgi:hypothetical protein